MVLSATSATAVASGADPMGGVLRQGVFALLGVPLMFLISRLPVAFLRKMAWPALFGAVALQLLVFTPLGIEDGGNRNWIDIGGFTLQPSEFLKLALALWIAAVLLRKQAMLGTWHHVFIPVIPVGRWRSVPCSPARTSAPRWCWCSSCWAVSSSRVVKLRLFIIPVVIGIGAVLAYALSSQDRMRRITATCDNMALYESDCYQSIHGIWGMASGGIFGLGLGNSQEKYGWLPAAGNDFIFAIVGEELGADRLHRRSGAVHVLHGRCLPRDPEDA